MTFRPAYITAVLLASGAGCKAGPSPHASAEAPAIAADSAPRLALQPAPGSGELERRIAEGQGLVQKLPRKVDAWVALGRTWSQKARESHDPGFYLNARDCADAALAVEPKSPLALGLLGQTELIQHRFAEALVAADAALVEDPADLTALAVRHDALLELGRYDDAAAAVQRMADLKPNLASYSRVSYLRWLHGDAVGALEAARLAIGSGRSARDPEPYAWALVQAALLFWHTGDLEGASAGFDSALASLPDYPPALVGKARIALTRGQAKDAVRLLERAAAQSPLVETLWLLGDAQAAANDPAAPATYARVVARGRQDDPRTLALFFATRRESVDEAVRLATRERERRGDLYTEDALGFALLQAGKPAEARPHLEAALRLGTRDAMLLYHRGLLELAEGRRDDGQRTLRDALALSPGFIGAADAKARLAP